MPRIPVVVIGAGQAGLAVSRAARPTPASTTSCSSAAAPAQRWRVPSVGVAAAAHPELDEPAARLAVHRPRPGRLHDRRARSPTTSTATRRPRARRWCSGADVLSVRPVRRRLPRRRRTAGHAGPPGPSWSPPAGATGRASRPSRPACDPALRPADPGRLPQPGGAAATAACWSWARRRPACSSPTSSPRAGRRVVAGGRLAHPAAPALPRAWTSCGGWTRWACSTAARVRPDARRARREPSLQLVGRPDGRDVDLPSLQDRGVALAGRLHRRRRHADPVRRRPAATRPPPRTPGCAGCSPGSTRTPRAAGLGDEIPTGRRRRPAVRRPTGPTELDLRAAGIRTVVWATGYRRRLPVAARARARRRPARSGTRRGVTPAPGLLRGRDALADPAQLDASSTACGTTRPPSSAGSLGRRWPAAAPPSRWRRRHEPAVGRRRRRRAGGRARRRRCCWPAPGCGCCASTGPAAAATRCPPTP